MNISKIIKIPLAILNDLLKFLIIYIPGSTGVRLRRFYYKSRFKKCGHGLIIDVGVSIDGAEFISVGDNVYIDKYCISATGNKLSGKIIRKTNKEFRFNEGEIVIGSNIHIVQYCILMGYGGIQIESNSVLSSNSKIYSLTNTAYNPDDKSEIVSIMPYSQAHFLLSPVVLKKNVWLGLNTVVMPGVTVNKNSFSASNSVLLDYFPENSYITGQPAKRIRNRFSTSNKEIF